MFSEDFVHNDNLIILCKHYQNPKNEKCIAYIYYTQLLPFVEYVNMMQTLILYLICTVMKYQGGLLY